MKRVPTFWIDGDWQGTEMVGYMVECDDVRYPKIAGHLTYEQAEKLVSDLNAGRVDYRRRAALG